MVGVKIHFRTDEKRETSRTAMENKMRTEEIIIVVRPENRPAQYIKSFTRVIAQHRPGLNTYRHYHHLHTRS